MSELSMLFGLLFFYLFISFTIIGCALGDIRTSLKELQEREHRPEPSILTKADT